MKVPFGGDETPARFADARKARCLERVKKPRDELDQLIADRDNDHDRLTYEHPKPSWVDDPDDTDRIHIRMRERRINYLENRLENVSRDLCHDFENAQEIE